MLRTKLFKNPLNSKQVLKHKFYKLNTFFLNYTNSNVLKHVAIMLKNVANILKHVAEKIF